MHPAYLWHYNMCIINSCLLKKVRTFANARKIEYIQTIAAVVGQVCHAPLHISFHHSRCNLYLCTHVYPFAELFWISHSTAHSFTISVFFCIAYGQLTRRSVLMEIPEIFQCCELHLAGYHFYVLNNAFVCHDGFKRRNTFHSTKDFENRRNHRIYTEVSPVDNKQ